MKERPIIFNTEMVKALLNGKTQTRRPMKYIPPQVVRIDVVDGVAKLFSDTFPKSDKPMSLEYKCPFGKVGDRLWVRETLFNDGDNSWIYCDGDYVKDVDSEWRKRNCHKGIIPSIHMPRWASRITLEITDVRVERVQKISENDALVEGIEKETAHGETLGWKNYLWHGHFGQYGTGNKKSDDWDFQYSAYDKARESFSSLWEKIYGKGAWERNDWVWVIEFKDLNAGGRG